MKKSWIQINGKLVPRDECTLEPEAMHFIAADIQPYKSMVTGEMIEGRRNHREHLKRHNVVEAADIKPVSKPQVVKSPKEQLAALVYERLRY